MLRLFLAAFIFGALVTLLVARIYPLPSVPLLISESVALANGGREESYYMRLPEDRLGSPRAAAVAAFPERYFAQDGEDRIQAELFRVRNSSGKVVGLASRMKGAVAVTDTRSRQNTDWMLLIPGRGALLMSTEGLPAEREKLYPTNRMGLNPATSGRILFGTEMYAGLTGFFEQQANIERTDASGQKFGVLTLKMRMQGTPTP